jgi:hypothetical protein
MTHETFGRFGILAIFDFESKSAQKRLLIKSPKSLPKTFLVKNQPELHC